MGNQRDTGSRRADQEALKAQGIGSFYACLQVFEAAMTAHKISRQTVYRLWTEEPLSKWTLKVVEDVLSVRFCEIAKAARPGRAYALVAELATPYGNDRFSVARVDGSEEYVAWSTDATSDPREMHRLIKDPAAGQWTVVPFPVRARGRYVFCNQERLVVIPESADEPISGWCIPALDPSSVRFPRRREWKMVTGCSLFGASLLVAHCGGDLWQLNLDNWQSLEVLPGSDEVVYVVVDQADRKMAVIASDHSREVQLINLTGSRNPRTISLPETAAAVAAFPESNLLVVAGECHVFGFDLQTRQLIYQHELKQYGLLDFSHSDGAAVFAMVTGWHPGNVLEIYDARSGTHLFHERATDMREWRAVSISKSGATFAAVRGADLMVFERSHESGQSEISAKRKEVTCPICKGTGTVTRDNGVWHGVEEISCPNCKGTRKVTKDD